MKFDTKIVVVLRDDLAIWQKLNMTAFLVSGIAQGTVGVMGEHYEDGSGRLYLPMFVQPVMVFAADTAQIRTVYERAIEQSVRFSVFTEDLFATGNDVDNRAAVKAVASDALKLTGMAFREDKKIADKIVKGLSLHK
jgi:hypothetical protein